MHVRRAQQRGRAHHLGQAPPYTKKAYRAAPPGPNLVPRLAAYQCRGAAAALAATLADEADALDADAGAGGVAPVVFYALLVFLIPKPFGTLPRSFVAGCVGAGAQPIA